MMAAPQRSTYSVLVDAGVVVVTDLDHGRSVTNDAEGVIEDLRAAGHDLAMPVIYRDTAGRWDRIAVGADGRFAGFLPIGGHDYAAARLRLEEVLAGEAAFREAEERDLREAEAYGSVAARATPFPAGRMVFDATPSGREEP